MPCSASLLFFSDITFIYTEKKYSTVSIVNVLKKYFYIVRKVIPLFSRPDSKKHAKTAQKLSHSQFTRFVQHSR